LLRIALILPSLSPADSSHSRIPIDGANRGAPRLPRRPSIHRLSPHIPLPARRTGRLRCPRSLPKRYCSLPFCASGVAVLDDFLVCAQEVFVLMPPRPGGRETSGRITRGPFFPWTASLSSPFGILGIRFHFHLPGRTYPPPPAGISPGRRVGITYTSASLCPCRPQTCLFFRPKLSCRHLGSGPCKWFWVEWV
jgi:hypothetical protein